MKFSFNWGHFWLLVAQRCFFEFACFICFCCGVTRCPMNHIYIYTTSQYSVIHHMLNHAPLVVSLPHNPSSRSTASLGATLFNQNPLLLKVLSLHQHQLIFSYQSMKYDQESTLQGCHKMDSVDHNSLLRRVYESIAPSPTSSHVWW